MVSTGSAPDDLDYGALLALLTDALARHRDDAIAAGSTPEQAAARFGDRITTLRAEIEEDPDKQASGKLRSGSGPVVAAPGRVRCGKAEVAEVAVEVS